MGETVTCKVCGDDVGKLGIGKHAGMHRRQFREQFGRPPKGYDEVREKLKLGHPADGPTLDDFQEDP